MLLAWRVVAIDMKGTRVVVDEGLSEEKALKIAGAMLQKGHNVLIETDRVPHESPQIVKN